MPYYITKDIINKSIINIFSDSKIDNQTRELISNDLENLELNVPNSNQYCEIIKKANLDNASLFNVSDMLFQLKDFKFYLGYVVNILIESCHYNDLVRFFSHMFVNHIGDVNYVSKDFNYEYNERYFDRFIESVKYCGIDNFRIIPFLFYVYNSDINEECHKFYRPSLEFLKGIIANNEASYLNYINNPDNYLTGYKIYLDIFDKKGADRLIDNLINHNYPSLDLLIELFLYKKDVCLNQLKQFIICQTGEKQIDALKFYLTFAQDVKPTLPELYEKIKEEDVKSLLKDEIELSKNAKFNTVKDFVDYVQLDDNTNVEEGISTKYLVYLKNNQKADDKILSYIFNIFKNISSPIVISKYKYLKEFFTEAELDNLGNRLLFSMNNRIDNDDKWVVTLICTLCSQDIVSKLVDIVPTCLGNVELSNFVLGCLVETNNSNVIGLIKQLYMESNNKQVYYNYLEILAKNNGITALDYLDEMVSNYGLNDDCERKIVCNGDTLEFKISDNLSIKVYNLTRGQYINLNNPQFVDTADAIEYFNQLTHEVRTQIDKFYNAYVNRRTWTIATFIANILSNPILKKISSTLTWGAYIKDTLVKVYETSEDVMQEPNQEVRIGLVHPVEMNNKMHKEFEPFKQINKQVFVANNANYSNSYSNEFNGVLVNDISFSTHMRALGYKLSATDGSYYYKTLKHDNLFIKVELIKSSIRSSSIVGNIKFYNLNLVQTTNLKYNFKDVKPEDVGSINRRVYSDILNDVYDACY